MTIPDFFQEFLTFFIQENSKIQNFEYEVIWRTPIRTKQHQVLLPSLQLAEVMAIPDFFKEFLTFSFKKIYQFKILSMRSYGELQYAQNDTKFCFLACN
jgi:hypothetical protein